MLSIQPVMNTCEQFHHSSPQHALPRKYLICHSTGLNVITVHSWKVSCSTLPSQAGNELVCPKGLCPRLLLKRHLLLPLVSRTKSPKLHCGYEVHHTAGINIFIIAVVEAKINKTTK